MSRAYGAAGRTGKLTLAMTLAIWAAWLLTAIPAEARPIRLLIFGDSLTAGYGLAHEDGFQAQLAASLRAHGHDVTIVDGAVSGDTTTGGLARLDWSLGDTPDQAPDAAILELGANDGLRASSPEAMEHNLSAILDKLAAKHIPVLLEGMLAPPNFGAAYDDSFRAVFTRLGARPGLIFDPFFLEGIAGDPSLNQPDHLHPNPEGVRRIVARILPLVEALLAKVPAG